MGGIEIVHVHEEHDVYGGRGEGTHMQNTEPPDRGWLGNPFEIGAAHSRVDVIALFGKAFITKLREDIEFRSAVDALEGQRVACWCRHADETEPPCHLDVVDQYVMYSYEDAYYYAEEELPRQYDD